MSVPRQVLRDDESQELECLHCSHSAVHNGEWGECRGFLLKSMIISTVLRSSPDSQLFNFLSVGRLTDRGVF